MSMIPQSSVLWHTPERETGDKVATEGLVAGDVCACSAGDVPAIKPTFILNFKFSTALPAGDLCEAQLRQTDLLYKQARPLQHVLSPPTPVCPSKSQGKRLAALFSREAGHRVSLPGHLVP